MKSLFSRKVTLWFAIAAIFAMVISPLGAVLGPMQVASAQESSESTPVAEPNPDEDVIEPGEDGEPSEADATPTADDPVEDPTVEPTAEPTEEPATPDDPIEPADTTLEQVLVTPYCYRAPEMTRVDNTGDTAITIISIVAVFDGANGPVNTPVPGTESISAGGTKIYRSGPDATSGTILTNTTSLFQSTTATLIEVEVTTNVGTVTMDCGANPNLQVTTPSDVTITLDCISNPERARVFNGGSAEIVINSIESLDGNPSPIVVDRPLGAGRTVIYRSNSGATSGTLLTLDEFYTDDLYDADGIRLNTTVGVVEAKCDKKPPTFPSELEVTIDCKNIPEWVKIINVGQGPVTLTGLESLYDQKPIEPFTLDKTLQPGQGVIYRSGASTGYNLLTSQYLYNPNVGEQEGVRIYTSTGKKFVTRCPGSPRIEINLSTQMLYAWEGNTLVASSAVATGKDGFLTPAGNFTIMQKDGTVTMAACSGGECWNVPNVPSSMLFRHIGYYIHGAYWHNNFGIARTSHGCVNLPVGFAAWLYNWANIGTPVWIHY